MSPLARSRVCRAGACLSTAIAFTAGCWHPALALPGVLGALWCAGEASQQQAAHRTAVAAEQAARPYPDPQPITDWEEAAEQARYDAAFDEITRPYRDQEAA